VIVQQAEANQVVFKLDVKQAIATNKDVFGLTVNQQGERLAQYKSGQEDRYEPARTAITFIHEIKAN